MNRPSRIVALWALLALLFAQMAVASYACPQQAPVMMAAVMDMGGNPCEMEDRSNVCASHCDYGTATVGPLDLHFPAAAVDAARVVRGLVLVAETVLAPRELRLPRGHSPPPLALFGALRI